MTKTHAAPARLRGLALTAVLLAATCTTGCVTTVQSGAQPTTRVVTCGPTQLAVEVTNQQQGAYRYTVTVRVTRDGLVEDFPMSTDAVAGGASATATTDGAWPDATCAVVGVQSFKA